jgi:hypothetical protein
MNKSVKLGLGSMLTAGALGAGLLLAPAASADFGFVCPTGSDTIAVPAAPGSTTLAGTVCVFSGTTAYRSLDTNAGWRAVAKATFGSPTTDVQFTQTSTRNKIEVLYKGGRLEIKR